MSRFAFCVARAATLATFFVAVPYVTLTQPAWAADFTVSSGTTDTAGKTLSGTDTGTVQSGGSLDVDDTAITIQGPTAGVVINNSGTINSSSDRAIQAKGSPQTITINNFENATISAKDDGFQLHDPIGDGTVTVNNAGTIVSTKKGQGLDFSNDTSADGTVVVNNAATGIIRADDDDAIHASEGRFTINNYGLIDSTESDNRGIELKQDDLDNVISFTVVNHAGGTIQAEDDAIKVSSDNADTTTGRFIVDNAGTIISTKDGQAIDFDDLTSTTDTVTIINRATGVIEADDADAIRPGERATVMNSGSIWSGGTLGSGDGHDGIDFQDHSGTVINGSTGVISGFRHGITSSTGITVFNAAGGSITGHNGSGVGSDGNGSVTNYGTITGAYAGVNSGDGDGVDIDYLAHVTNYGIIQGTGADQITDFSEGLALGGGTVVNAAGALISGANNGILVDDGNGGSGYYATTLTNAGTIRGLDGFGIRLVGDFNDQITNSGIIYAIGGTTLDMGAGNDTLTIEKGSAIEGLATGGDGTDTLNYDKVGFSAAKVAALESGQTVNVGGTLYSSFEQYNGVIESFSQAATSRGAKGIAGILDNGSNTIAASLFTVQVIDAVASSSNVNRALLALTPSAFQNYTRITTDIAGKAGDLIDRHLYDMRYGAGAHPHHRGLCNGFLDATGMFVSQDRQANAPGYAADTGMVAGGADYCLSRAATVGVFAAAGHTYANLDKMGSHSDITTLMTGLYGSLNAGGYDFDGAALYGHGNYDTTRMAFGTANRSTPDSNALVLHGLTGRNMALGRWTMRPEIGAQYTKIWVDSFSENGPLALTVGSDDAESLRGTLGFRLQSQWTTKSGLITPEFQARWVHEFLDHSRTLHAELPLDPSFGESFTTVTAPGQRDYADVGASLSRSSGPVTFKAEYDAQIGANSYVGHTVSVRLRYLF